MLKLENDKARIRAGARRFDFRRCLSWRGRDRSAQSFAADAGRFQRGSVQVSSIRALIAAARMLEPVEFGVFAVLTALVGVVNAVVSGGGDMWLNSFTGSSTRKLGHAPRISPAYLTTCLALAATMAAVISGVFFASNVSSVSEWIDGHAPQVAIFLTEFPLATLLAVLGACFAGLFEAQLAVLRAGNRVTEFLFFAI